MPRGTTVAKAFVLSTAIMGAAVVAAPRTVRTTRRGIQDRGCTADHFLEVAAVPPPAGDPGTAALPAAATCSDEVRQVVRCSKNAGPEAVAELRRLALESPDPLVAGNAVRALGRLGAVTGDERVVSLLRDPRPRVRQELVMALGENRDPFALDELTGVLEAEDSSLRALAIQAIGRIGGRRASEILEGASAEAGRTGLERVFLRDALSECR
jgi:HEAT repeat protein